MKIINTGVTTLSGIGSLTNLTTLEMTYNSDLKDISNLSGCTSLVTANLNNNAISSIESIKNIATLTTLNVSYNGFSTIPDMTNMTSLVTLNMKKNNIENLSNLNTLLRGSEGSQTTTLRTLNLDINPLEDEAKNGYDNHALLVKLKKAKCSTITMTETSLSSV